MPMIIDRIEGGVAVVELAAGRFRDIPLDEIEGRARDGAVLREAGGGAYEVDEDETVRRAAHARRRLDGLFGRQGE